MSLTRGLMLAALAVALAASAFAFGLYHGATRSSLYFQVLTWKKLAFGEPLEFDAAGRYIHVEDRTALPCPGQSARTMVAVVFGQSNAANHLGHRHAGVDERTVNFFDGRCYLARDPLLGASGNIGSAWTLLANKLLSTGRYDAVVLVPIARGHTSIARWARGDLQEVLQRSLRQVRAAGFDVTDFLWQQGEADSGRTPGPTYRADLEALIASARNGFPRASFWVTRTSTCPGRPVDEALRAAQAAVVDPKKRIFAGPDTDSLSRIEERYDGCHFSMLGQERLTELWLRALERSAD